MNPFPVIEKWISEHGSAAVLRDHVALLKEKMTAMEAKVGGLEKQVADLPFERTYESCVRTENPRKSMSSSIR